MARYLVGDRVRLKKGWTPMIVAKSHRGFVTAVYEDSYSSTGFNAGVISGSKMKIRPPSEFAPWRGVPKHAPNYHSSQNKDKFEMRNDNKTTLYQTVHKGPSLPSEKEPHAARYGTFLAKSSDGKIVLEMKGDGKVESFDPSDIEKVMPYSFKAKVVGRDSHNPHTCHYSCTKGEVEVGDFLMSATGNMYLVIEIDTKVEDVKKAFKGAKLVGEKIGDK